MPQDPRDHDHAPLDVTLARRLQARRAIYAIDMVLEAVEQHHLARRPRGVPPLPQWIACLEQGGLPIPEHILEIRNTVELHAALLDWQEHLLDTALPARTRFTREDREADLAHRRVYVRHGVG